MLAVVPPLPFFSTGRLDMFVTNGVIGNAADAESYVLARSFLSKACRAARARLSDRYRVYARATLPARVYALAAVTNPRR